MDTELLYELVVDAVRSALTEELGGDDVPIARRMAEGRVVFIDGADREVKTLPATVVFRKITAVRERLRVLEQRINNAEGLDDATRADVQAFITRAQGSLTTFNFLFADDAHKFRGQSE